MAMGRRQPRQEALWVATDTLRAGGGHPFYRRLNGVLSAAGFDAFVEQACARYYAARMGRPSIAPGVYFRLLLIGYFEGIDSERGIAWRAADSLALREFLGFGLAELPPDHSTISRTRRLLDAETHEVVFSWVLQELAARGLVSGQTIGIDATTLEANAAMRSIVRRDTGEGYRDYLVGLAQASGIATPTRAALTRLDRRRRKRVSNREWVNPHDPEAKITRMKDGRTHLAYKAEHAVDMDSGAVIGVTVQAADAGDTRTGPETLAQAVLELAILSDDPPHGGGRDDPRMPDTVMDKGYHSNGALVQWAQMGVRTYISEPDRGQRRWRNKQAERRAVYANRRRIKARRGLALLRKRGELLERAFTHYLDNGRMRRVHLRGASNILKRLLIQICGFNLGLIMRQLIGIGTPRGLQGRSMSLAGARAAWRAGQWHIGAFIHAIGTIFGHHERIYVAP